VIPSFVTKQQQREELADFLRTRRAKVSPLEVGLPARPRKRTPGLRREDVAELAGTSVTWYTWLEQAREINVSAETLDSISAALRLTDDERRYLFTLAEQPLPKRESRQRQTINPALESVLKSLTTPAFVLGRYLNVLAWNKAAKTVFGYFLKENSDESLNWARAVFEKRNRRFIVGWEDFAQCTLAVLRTDYARHLSVDPQGAKIIDELQREFPEFAKWWAQHEVLDLPHRRKEFNHPQIGRLAFEYVALQIEDEADMRLYIYTPLPEFETAAKIQKLANDV
jgi:transcriptional regulator with XRE-family HTH domain